MFYLGLGANLGDPIQQQLDAVVLLTRFLDATTVRRSSWYRTSPIGFVEQPSYINSVVEFHCVADVENVLHVAQRVEHILGRERDPMNRNAPRTVDIDVLLHGHNEVNTDSLIVPHPRMFERRFVIEPLLDVLPREHPYFARCKAALVECQRDNSQILERLIC